MAKTTAAAAAAAAKKTAKAPAAKKATGNLPLEEAKTAILKKLTKGRATRTELKAVAPYGNYTALMAALEGDGLIKEDKQEGDSYMTYDLTAKGRAAAKK